MIETLQSTTRAIIRPGRGILAADESPITIRKRFDAIGIESTERNRRDYREMLFSTHVAMMECISGVILHDETIRQRAKDSTPLIDLIKKTGAILGIKVDTGTRPMAGFIGETITAGLDGLDERLAEYYELGARFAKWRAVINISLITPSWACIEANTEILARYAALCQKNGIVPIVEPEILMDGNHTDGRCFEVTETTLRSLFNRLALHNVSLESTILKPNMILSGRGCAIQASMQEVAEKTIKALKRTVPAAIPGIFFLSGGQSDYDATAHLNAINTIGDTPWTLSFSYGRALQAAPMKAWSGKPENVNKGQKAFAHRAKMNSYAALGRWKPELEKS
jgi:fructose-bisphosphate aldolase class I